MTSALPRVSLDLRSLPASATASSFVSLSSLFSGHPRKLPHRSLPVGLLRRPPASASASHLGLGLPPRPRLSASASDYHSRGGTEERQFCSFQPPSPFLSPHLLSLPLPSFLLRTTREQDNWLVSFGPASTLFQAPPLQLCSSSDSPPRSGSSTISGGPAPASALAPAPPWTGLRFGSGSAFDRPPLRLLHDYIQGPPANPWCASRASSPSSPFSDLSAPRTRSQLQVASHVSGHLFSLPHGWHINVGGERGSTRSHHNNRFPLPLLFRDGLQEAPGFRCLRLHPASASDSSIGLPRRPRPWPPTCEKDTEEILNQHTIS